MAICEFAFKLTPPYKPAAAMGVLLTGFLLFLINPATASGKVIKPKKPLRILLVTGGCCHNYVLQSGALQQAVKLQAEAEWTIVNEGGKGTQAMIGLYDSAGWAKGYDVVVHNECFADTKTPEYIKKITSAHHAGVPAVVIHCAMHSYRLADIDDRREMLGVTSRRHDHQARYPVKVVNPNHAVVKAVPVNWVTPMDELYVIEKLWPNAKALAEAVSEKDGKSYPVIWTNQYGKARVFGTSFGHSDDTFRDPVFLDYLAKGIVWAAGRLKK